MKEKKKERQKMGLHLKYETLTFREEQNWSCEAFKCKQINYSMVGTLGHESIMLNILGIHFEFTH